MSKPAWKLATEHFYEWDHRCRGYHHFDTAVNIEPPYIPFVHKKSASLNEFIDDGKILGFWDSLAGFFKSKKLKSLTQKTCVLKPNAPSIHDLDTGISMKMPIDEDNSTAVFIEFINMLNFTKAPIGFEIVATFNSINLQMLCSNTDKTWLIAQIRAFFPSSVIKNIKVDGLPFKKEQYIVISDFGLNTEFVRPIKILNPFDVDPLTTIISMFNRLSKKDVAVLQIIYKGVSNPWERDILNAVSDGNEGSFFINNPEMLNCAKEKVSAPLFSCIVRLAVQRNTEQQSKLFCQQLIKNISIASSSEFNKLIPLSNKNYKYEDHLYNLYHRKSNRYGMLLNSKELVSFLHYPTVLKLKVKGVNNSNNNNIDKIDAYSALQNYVKKFAIQRGFNVDLEKKTSNGARIDIEIIKGSLKIAIEISTRNTLEDEVLNIQKCIDSGYNFVYMVSGNMTHLKNIKRRVLDVIKKNELEKIKFLNKYEVLSYLNLN